MFKKIFQKSVVTDLENLSVEEIEKILSDKKELNEKKARQVIEEKFPKDFIKNAKKILDSEIVKVTLSEDKLELYFSLSLYTIYEDKRKCMVVHVNESYIDEISSNSNLVNDFIKAYVRSRMTDQDSRSFILNADSLKKAIDAKQKLVSEVEKFIESLSKQYEIDEDIVWDIINNN